MWGLGRVLWAGACTSSFVSSIVVWTHSYAAEPGYDLLFLLPFCFGLCLAASRQLRKNVGAPSIAMMLLALWARYVVVPSLIAVSGAYGASLTVQPWDDSLHAGILLMLYEMACILGVANVLAPRLLRGGAATREGSAAVDWMQWQLVFPAVVLIGVAICFAVPEARGNYRFFLDAMDPSDQSARVRSGGTGLIALTVEWARLLVGVVVLNWIGLRFRATQSRIVVVLTLIGFLPVVIFVMRSSRESVLFPLVAAAFLCARIYPNCRRFITAVGVTTLLAVLGFVTASKNFSRPAVDAPVHPREQFAAVVQAYASPPHAVALALETETLLSGRSSRWELFVADTLASVPFVGRKLVTGLSSTTYFNIAAYGRDSAMDQLLPMVSQANLHLGVALAPLYGVAFVFCAFLLDRRASVDRRPEFIFLDRMMMAKMAVASVMANWTTMMAAMTSMWLPLYLLCLLNRRLSHSVPSSEPFRVPSARRTQSRVPIRPIVDIPPQT